MYYVCKKEKCLYGKNLKCKFTEMEIEDYKIGIRRMLCLGGENIDLKDLKTINKEK